MQLSRLLIGFMIAVIMPALIPSVRAQSNLADIPNPIIGTKQVLFFHGRTTPFVTPPFGMTHWTPQTRVSKIKVLNYHYGDKAILGFKGSHKPAKWMGDYGFVSLMPGVGKIKTLANDRKLRFSHKDETSKAYSYSVELKAKRNQRIQVEMTATERCGILRFTFQEGSNPFILIEASQNPDFEGWIKIDTAANEIIGYNADRNSAITGPKVAGFKGYFVIKFDKPMQEVGVWEDGETHLGLLETKGSHIGAWIRTEMNTTILQAKIGSSFISIEQARENLEREIPNFSYKKVEEETRQMWEKYLHRIEIEGGSETDRSIFYSAMYHTLLFPRQFSEYGRYYSAFDDTIHAGVSYNDFSLWDTFRAQHPLLHFTAAEHVSGMVNALIQMYEEGGYMPKWPNPTYTNIMIGTHADAVVADAMVKEVNGIDPKRAYAAVWKDAMVPPTGDSTNRWHDRAPWTAYEARGGLSWYKELGYVPIDKTSESVSRTLEFAYDDFCVAQVAKIAGKEEDAKFFLERSDNYKNVFNPETGFMSPRNSDGTWYKKRKHGFTEGGPWTYLFCVMQDVPGMIDLMGGKEAFSKKLTKGFGGIFRYIHENEPGHHYTYLYDYVGEAWKTQQKVAKYRAKKYRNTPFGLNGDDDCGQMSAWYVFSSLGFYPVTPGSDVYAIGTPLFPKATMRPNPEDLSLEFVITATDVSEKNIYIQSAKLNGKQLETPFLHHSDIINGGSLEYEMGPKPMKGW